MGPGAAGVERSQAIEPSRQAKTAVRPNEVVMSNLSDLAPRVACLERTDVEGGLGRGWSCHAIKTHARSGVHTRSSPGRCIELRSQRPQVRILPGAPVHLTGSSGFRSGGSC